MYATMVDGGAGATTMVQARATARATARAA
jgi:hypothetical protein